jgi:AraC family transcriptional regulator, regulatory protein of adaptative response / methylated-DNA-[protein]-cysteine methyltransferase
MTTSVAHDPSAAKATGAHVTLRYAVGTSTLGSVLVASSRKGVACILIGDDPRILVEELKANFPGAAVELGTADDDRRVDRVVDLIEVPSTGFDLPLDVRGTPFQRKVWSALQRIPVGATTTYSALAACDPKAVRAVAGACAANKLAVAIPCHRVVRSDGSSSGYRWGVARKHALIEREATTR